MPLKPKQIFGRKLGLLLGISFIFSFYNISFSQPTNDLCNNASFINVPKNHLGVGVFTGKHVAIDSATREKGETCAEKIAELGNCGKTVWYTFTIGTTRDVSVILKQQDSSIPQIFAGFTIYKVENCDYNAGNISDQLTPIGKFGSSGNSCLQAGVYYIQVSAREKAKGILWAEVNIAEPTDQVGNKWSNPDNLGIITDQPLSKGRNNFCLSIDTNEFKSNLPKGFTKSYWVKVEFRANAIQNIFTIRAYFNQNSGNIGGYRIFKNSINVDSVTSNKPFTFFKKNVEDYVINESCKSPSAKEVVYIQFIFLTEVQSCNIYTRSEMQVNDAWNTPDTDFKITTDNRYNNSFVRYFNCSGLLADHRCNSVPDTFISDISGTNFTDTFKYGAYLVVKSTDYGELRIFAEDISRYSYSPILYILYKGDVSTGCDLVELQRSQNSSTAFCLEPGTYTVLVTRPNHYYRSTYVKLNIDQRAIPKNIIAFKHSQPIVLGNVKPSTNTYPITATIHINVKDTTVELDTFKKTGRFIFREFFLEEDASFKLSAYQNDWFTFYLFKGQFSQGTTSLLPDENYSSGYTDACQEYKAGFYSILAYHDTTKAYFSNRCELPYNRIIFSPRNVCTNTPFNSSPGNSVQIFNNQDLLTGNSYKSDISYIYPLEYCIDCKTETKPEDRPVVGCNRKLYLNTQDTFLFYYTFYINKNAEVELPNYSILYAGDAKQNPSIVSDSLNVVDPCNPNFGNIYCNLKGGEFYTLAIYNPQYVQVADRRIIVTPHQKSVNDYAINSRDLGKIEVGNTYKSPYDVITCHTYFAATDPCAKNYSDQMRCPVPVLKEKAYLDTINKGRYRERQNLWYTFTVSDASTVQLKVNTPNFCRQRITVYKYVGNYVESFSDLRVTGFDSSRNGLMHVAENDYLSGGNCRKNTLTFQNSQCITNRYFVLIDGEYSANASYQLEVSKTLSNITYSPGDQCASPAKLSINRGGNYTTQTKNHCHSYGGSPYENGDDPSLKSTWFEIDITQIQKYDLGISFLGAISIKGFTIYAGNCGAMTKIVELNDQYSYFSLSCMGVGKYYIQVITNSYNVGDIKFQVTVDEKLNAPCKPYDFEQPLSGFEVTGGCNNDTITLNNRSTKGNDISYSWYINNQLFSQLENPKLIRPDARLQINNQFKLIVFNRISGLRDTTMVEFENDTTTYYVKIQQPKPFNCLDTFNITYKTNYPYKLNLFWEPSYRFGNPYAETQEISRVTDEKIFLTAISENCILKDSIHLIGNKPTGFFKDDILCNGINELTYDISNFPIFRANNLPPTNNKTFTITESGNYTLLYFYNGCYFYDTIEITPGGAQIKNHFSHDTTICLGDTVLLKSPKTYRKYDWKNNIHTQSLAISKSGNYILTGEVNSCEEDIHTFTVKAEIPKTNFILDTSICKNDWFYFTNPFPKLTLVYRSPDLDSFQVLNNTPIEMQLQDSHCINKAKAMVKVIEHPNEFKEETVCLEIEEGIWLDAKSNGSQAYNWLDLNHFEPLFWAETYNKYSVERNYMNGCRDTLQFDVKENCPVTIFIPNAFSPNKDGINSVFKPFISGTYESYHLLIFNRWGEVLLDQTNGVWDGTYMGSRVPAGVYSAIIQVKVKGKITKQYVQTITVVL